MELDPVTCYRAIRSRDPRFDGRFFTAVRSTGVYCRPICPAPTPLLKNVRFYPCAAAAEAAGFRPCRRCRPETTPGTPGWMGASATVSRALRLIEQGELEHGGMDLLARRLGVGARHLRRLFVAHLGASPQRVAHTRRAHFAKRLLDETGLPMREVASSAGFESVRQFNHEIRATFGLTPTAIRRASHTPVPGANGALAMRLPLKSPYDWSAIASFLATRAIPGVERVSAEAYLRTFVADGTPGVFEVRPERGARALELRVFGATGSALLKVVRGVRRLFDLDADPAVIAARLSASPILRASVARRPGLRLPGAWDPFETAVRAILGQQVTVRAATTLCGRLVQVCGTPCPGARDHGLTHLFPTPAAFEGADLSPLRMPGARKDAIRSLAREVATDRIVLGVASDLDTLVARLRALPGVGDWTAQVVAMRACGEVDAFPAGDLGVRQALARRGKKPSEREASRIAEAWRPWRAYACMHLWIMNASKPRPRRKETRRED